MRRRFDQCWSTDAAECPTFTSLLREYAGETRPLAKEINPAINPCAVTIFRISSLSYIQDLQLHPTSLPFPDRHFRELPSPFLQGMKPRPLPMDTGKTWQ